MNQLIAEWMPDGSHVLDLGCGKGELLKLLEKNRNVTGIGVEISQDLVAECIEQGLHVIQDDFEKGLDLFSQDTFDYLVLSRTLQETRDPEATLRHIMQAGKRAIVSIDNAGHLRKRLAFLFGSQPLAEGSGALLQHQITTADFEKLCARAQVRIVQRKYLTKKSQTSFPLLAETAVYQLEKTT